MALSGQVVKSYVEKHPKLPSLTLAKKIFAEQTSLFRDEEHCRSLIRYYRGNHGKKARKNCTDKTNHRPNQKAGYIPHGVRRTYRPLTIQQPGSYLILSDMHTPYHDEQAIELAIERGLSEGCTGVILNGDSIDFYQLSKFNKDPRERSPKDEITVLRKMLHQLNQRFEHCYFKAGNHEDRWEMMIFDRHPYLADFEELDLQNILHLKDHGFKYIPSKQWIRLSKLNILHGHEVPRGISTTVNPARTLWLRVKQTALVAHHHRSSQHNENHPMEGKITCTWSIGCLCDTHPTWSPLNEWNLGFAIVDVTPSRFEVQNYLIQSGSVYEI